MLHCRYLHRVAPLRPYDNFVFYCHDIYHRQLREVIEHLPNVELKPLAERTPEAINCWVGWRNPWMADYLRFTMAKFARISEETGLPNLFQSPDDLLFDYPALRRLNALSKRSFDFLIVNSRPESGQLDSYDEEEFEYLIALLSGKGHSVVTTKETRVTGVECTLAHGLSITGIGNLSMRCRNHICVNTSPSWPSYNLWNAETVDFRAVLHNQIELGFETFKVHSFDRVPALIEKLREIKLL